jgi:SAM-dependent methyltransferase
MDVRNAVDGWEERVAPEDLAGPNGAHHLARYLFAAHFGAGRSVADLCCGTGYGTNLLLASGATRALGIDASPEAVKRATESFSGPEYSVGNVTEPLGLQADMRVCFEGIEHVGDPAGLVDNLRRDLPPNGVAIISTPNGERGHSGNPHHVKEFTRAELRDLLSPHFPEIGIYFQWWYPDPFDLPWRFRSLAKAVVPVKIKSLFRRPQSNVSAPAGDGPVEAISFRPLPEDPAEGPPAWTPVRQARDLDRRVPPVAALASRWHEPSRNPTQAMNGAWRVFARRREETPVVLSVDVEPDPQAFDPSEPPPWLGFERLVEKMPALRDRLSTATGSPAAFTWHFRMDPQIADTWGTAGWPVENFAGAIDGLVGEGDEIALHTHIWRWKSETGDWICDFDDYAWQQHCVEVGLEAFETSVGSSCRAHRGGTHFLSGAILETLASRGVPVDLTVEPGLRPLGADDLEFVDGLIVRGRTPDYRRAPTRPYRSTPGTFPAPDPASRDDGPLLIPNMSARRRRPPFRRTSLLLWDPQGFSTRIATEFLRPPPIICFPLRTDAALGPWWEIIEQNLDHVARHPRVAFKTVSAAVGSRAPVPAL